MSEIKFACPYCAQHIACDDAYCGNALECPACGERLFVPRLAAFARREEGRLMLALPVAGKSEAVRQTLAPAALHVWTDEEWQRHLAEYPSEPTEIPPLVWMFLVLPFLFSLPLIFRGAGVRVFIVSFLVAAVMAGFVWASSKRYRGSKLLIGSAGFALVIIAVTGSLVFAVIAGCSALGGL